MAKTIMTIDDSISIRQVLGLTLRGAGYQVVEGVDGQDALNKLTEQKVHLIICDVYMPNMDGITFLKEVKKNPDFRYIPIIMLTTESQKTAKMEGRKYGAKAWVVKPFRPEQLIRAIEKLLIV